MGLLWSRTSRRSHPGLPDTELTPCAIMLYRMGYRVVALTFEHAVVTMTPVVENHTHRGYFTVPHYLEERRRELVQMLAANVANEACTFIVSLLAQGIAVVITTEADDQRNGEVVKASSSSSPSSLSSSSGFQYDGKELIQRVMLERLGPDLAKMIHVTDLDEALHHKHPEELLLVSPSSEIVKKARKRHMGAIHVPSVSSP